MSQRIRIIYSGAYTLIGIKPKEFNLSSFQNYDEICFPLSSMTYIGKNKDHKLVMQFGVLAKIELEQEEGEKFTDNLFSERWEI